MTTPFKRRWDAVTLREDDMHDYQRIGTQFLREHPSCALLIDLGMGKTVISATVACERLGDWDVDKVLIVAPLRVANTTWPDELRNWHHLAGYRFSVITGDEPTRIAAVNRRASIYIVNRENIPWLVDHWGKHWPYEMVIIDESTSFKDYKTTRFKKMALLRKHNKVKYLIELTASPAAESYEHFFGQIYLLDGGKRFGQYITKFRDKYFDFNKYTFKLTLKEGAKEEIEDKISDITLAMKAEDWLGQTKPHYVTHHYTLPSKVRNQYAKMMKDFLLEVDGDVIEAQGAASLASKLRQISSGFLYRVQDDYNEDTGEFETMRDAKRLHKERIAELLRLIEECPDENLLIAYHFKESLDMLKQALPKATVMDKAGKCVKKWNEGKIKLLLAHPQSAGHGLNLQKGGRRIIFYEMPYSLEYYEQFVGRLNRQGQTKTVYVHHLIGRDTQDTLVYDALQRKANVQAECYRALKKLQRQYLKGLIYKDRVAHNE